MAHSEDRLIYADSISNGIALYLAENAYLNDTAQGALEMVAKWINEAPTVDAVPVWIPVTERLPEKNGKYLCRYVFNSNYDMPFEQVLSYYATDNKPHFNNEGDEFSMRVTHWMPLPEPPEEG